MDGDTITTIIGQVPNLVIAIWVIINYQNTIKVLLDNQQKLVENLLALHPPADTESDKV